MNASSPKRPGRLGDPDLELADDPRADPRMVAALAALQLDRRRPPPAVGPGAPLADRLDQAAANEHGFEKVFASLVDGLDPVPGVGAETLTIDTDDGRAIVLHVHRPARPVSAPLPGAVHLHGGGMAMLRTSGPLYRRWRDELAALGMVAIGVEFRNSAGVLGNHPFPAGLDDCTAAFRWVADHRESLGIGPLIATGESGGANLALALAIRAKREGWADAVDGVYAQAPFISNLWGVEDSGIASHRENDGHFVQLGSLSVLGSLYDPTGENADEATCWPYRATVDDLRGLPPHAISVNELDPLRDEGITYFRTLLAAGVPATGRVVLGTVHTGDLMFRRALPEVYAASIADVYTFACGLAA